MSGAGHIYAAMLIVASLLLVLAAASGLVNNRLWVSEPILCVIVGVIAGPVGFGWIINDMSPSSAAHDASIEAARFALSIAVVGAVLRLPSGYLRRSWRELGLVLGAGMLLTSVIGAGVAMLLLGWQLLPALLLGAVLAPTDPVLAASIVAGRYANRIIPDRLRNTISAESAANDGLALLLLMVPAALLVHGGDGAGAWTMWWQTCVREIGVALLVGSMTGFVSSRLLRWASRHGETEVSSLVTLALSLAVATTAACRLLDTSGILACFIAGAWLNETLSGDQEKRHHQFHQAISRFFELPFFVFFGALLPWSEWFAMGSSGILFALALLFLRRPLAWAVLWRWLPSLHTRSDHVFAGWFGPVGIAALFYALQWSHELDLPILWTVVSLVVVLSLLLHGTTATPLTRVLIRTGNSSQH